MRRKEGSRTFKSAPLFAYFYNYSGDQETTKNTVMSLIPKVCALQLGNNQKLMMVPAKVNSQEIGFTTVSTVFFHP